MWTEALEESLTFLAVGLPGISFATAKIPPSARRILLIFAVQDNGGPYNYLIEVSKDDGETWNAMPQIPDGLDWVPQNNGDIMVLEIRDDQLPDATHVKITETTRLGGRPHHNHRR